MTAVPRGGVYTLRDEAGVAVRTGRSANLAVREQQLANDPVLGQYECRTDVYAEQRGLEQILYDRNPGARVANGGFNAIRAVNPANPSFGDYIEAAFGYLDRLGGG